MYFITMNENKFTEVKHFFKDIRDVKAFASDLPELQDSDPKEIVKMKLEVASKHRKGEFIVEDTSLHLDSLNGLPGPFIKWFMDSLGVEGIYDLAKRLGDVNAEARSTIGYFNKEKIEYFVGSTKGKLVRPRGNRVFGFDQIFQPEGHLKTYSEMDIGEKNATSHRGKALAKLKKFLEEK